MLAWGHEWRNGAFSRPFWPRSAATKKGLRGRWPPPGLANPLSRARLATPLPTAARASPTRPMGGRRQFVIEYSSRGRWVCTASAAGREGPRRWVAAPI